MVTFDEDLHEEGGAVREFPASPLPTLERSGIRIDALRRQTCALPPGTRAQVSMLC